MLVGVEYNESYKALVASHFNRDGKVDVVVKKLTPQDHFVWATSRDQTPHVGYDGTSIRKMETDRPGRYRLEELMHEKFTKEDWDRINENNYPNAYFLDIETEAAPNNEFPEPEEAKYPVNLISIVSQKKPWAIVLSTLAPLDDATRKKMMSEVNEYVGAAYTSQKWRREEYELDYFYFETEKELLEHFFYKVLPKLPLISGWNVIDFDWQTLINRAEKCGVDPVRRLQSKSLTGQYRLPVHTGMIDYIEALLKFRPIKQPENHQLDYIARRSIGIGKMPNPYGTFYQFQKDHYLFIKYNIIDSILVKLVDMKHHLLAASYEIATIARVELNKIFGPVFMTEMFMCRLFLLDNKHMWIKKKRTDIVQQKYLGAYVKEPETGFHEFIACFDFASMYPNIQLQFNISPDSFLGRLKQVNTALLEPGSFIVTKNDTVFTKKFDSVARKVLDDLYKRRAAARREIKRLKQILEDDAAISVH
jgi:DNA polymerase elongation subunit (family B)